MTELRCGDIALVAGGVYASKPRPAVILQDDLFTGIDSESFVMIDKVTTVRRSNISEPIGHLDGAQMLELERRLMVFLGLAH